MGLLLRPGDDLVAPLLADEIATRAGDQPLVLVSADGHDARLFSEEAFHGASRLHLAAKLRFEYKPQEAGPAELAARVVQSGAGAVVLAAGAVDSAKLVTALRAAGYKGSVFGGPWMGRRQFVEKAGVAAEGCLFPLLFAAGKPAEDFAAAFSRRSGAAARLYLRPHLRRRAASRGRPSQGGPEPCGPTTPCGHCRPGKALPA